MIHKFIFFINISLALFCDTVVFAQSSFVREAQEIEMDISSFNLYLSQIEEGDNGQSSFLYSYPDRGDLWFVGLGPTGDVYYSYSIGIDESTWRGYWYQKKKAFQLGVCHGVTLLTNPRIALVVLNLEQENYWAKQLGTQAVRRDFAGFTNSGKVYSSFYMETNTIFENKLGIAIFDQESGNQEWGFHYERSNTPIPNEEQSYTIFNIKSYADNSLVTQIKLTHRELGSSGLENGAFGYGLLHIDEEGAVIKSVGIDDDHLFYDIDVDDSDNLYLALKEENEGETIYERNPNGVIVKLDKDFNVLWSKKLVVENFYSDKMKIKTKPNGNIIFSYVTIGDLPVITGEITSSGELLWYRGYSFFRPLISIGNDNSIYFTSQKKYYPNGTFDYKFIIAKTLPSGEIENCPQFDACISLEDIDIHFDDWEWTREVAPPLPDLEISLDTAYFESTPYCGTPLPPRADFIVPDTICQYECVSPDSVYNRLAHQIEWHITGPGVDTIIIDSTFNWCFDGPGHYDISQEVWLLGCSEYYERSVEVLADDLQVFLGEDRTICTPKPYVLSAAGSRPLVGYLWNDGSEEASLTVDTSGLYGITVTDGYCTANNRVSLNFLEDIIDEPPLVLPPDTLICNDFLPYVLIPRSPYTSEFYLNNGSVAATEFSLSQSGNYQVKFSLEGCEVSGEFIFETASCEVPIFIPNVFSPNDDGVNDFVAPLGVDFEGLSLEIYDRWGGQLLHATQPPFRWDGQANGRDVSTGVYVLVFRYLNKRNGLEEDISREVMLLR